MASKVIAVKEATGDNHKIVIRVDHVSYAQMLIPGITSLTLTNGKTLKVVLPWNEAMRLLGWQE